MKKIACLFASLIILACSACGKAEAPYISSEDIQESRQTNESVSNIQEADVPLSGKLTYTNLDSQSSVEEVRSILTKAGIQAIYVDTVLDWAADYNNCMRGCPAFSLVGDFVTIDEAAVDYGEYYPMYTEWYKHNARNYPDVLCRIAAFELVQNNISVNEVITKDNFDCWDENRAWLYTDGDILFGREAEAYEPYPMIDWSDDIIASYFTLFDPIRASEEYSEQEMLQAIQKKWSEHGISFKENNFSLITFWTQSDDKIAVAHAAVLIERNNDYLLFEKTNPLSPYAASKFSSTDDVKQYLYNKMNLEYLKYDFQMGTYIILENDRLL
ncbi:MAG: DUF4300 family protein [Oscillospiraceae bacterium]|nr:DUF4300 family protein [Oscillospiraceae bacterium]